MRSALSFAKIFILLLGISCVSVPNRPDYPVCVSGTNGWMCTDASGDFPEEATNLICTTGIGYTTLERYISELELRIRKLERRCKN
jgi:hypothetical protein